LSDDTIRFFVAGEPQSKGSTRAFVVKGRPIITSSNRNLKGWEQRVAHEAQVKAAEVGWMFDAKGSFDVEVHFFFPVPGSYPKKWWFAHTKRPDLDKLARAVLDGLTRILFVDDAQVTGIEATKGYCVPAEGERPGVDVTVKRLPGRWPR
jgi:Holliday junction resolvase RusA-like endonuclease